MTITDSDQKELLSLAREAITERIAPDLCGNQKLHKTESLQTHAGVFVSVYVNEKLRGCIGTFSEETPLYKNVRNMARSAATNDSRFSPLQVNELDHMHIEISVLTPRILIHDTSEIIIGRHGIFMKKGSSRGTFLPQVAPSQNWSVDEFLGNCAKYKALIGWDGWKTADLYTYEAIIFSSGTVQSNC
jgi:hypothetical protein